MPGLTGRAAGKSDERGDIIERARRSWEASMARQIDDLRTSLRSTVPQVIADRAGGSYDGACLSLEYWGDQLRVAWPELEVYKGEDPCPTFDTAMVFYYLSSADGAPFADRWIGYRELPGGGFYNQAFQGYSGDRIARAFGSDPDSFHLAARSLGGWSLPALAEHAYAFQPLPRIRLAAVLWPGDEEFPSKASVLFDPSACHYMTIDGLALLGSGLSGRLVKALTKLTAGDSDEAS